MLGVVHSFLGTTLVKYYVTKENNNDDDDKVYLISKMNLGVYNLTKRLRTFSHLQLWLGRRR